MPEIPPRFSELMERLALQRETPFTKAPAKKHKQTDTLTVEMQRSSTQTPPHTYCVLQHTKEEPNMTTPNFAPCQHSKYAWIPHLLDIFEQAALVNARPHSPFCTQAVFGTNGLSSFHHSRFKIVMEDIKTIFPWETLTRKLSSSGNLHNWSHRTYPSLPSQKQILSFLWAHQSVLEKAYREAISSHKAEPSPAQEPGDLTSQDVLDFMSETLSFSELTLAEPTRRMSFAQYALCCEYLLKTDLPWDAFKLPLHKVRSLKKGLSSTIPERAKLLAARHIQHLIEEDQGVTVIPPVITQMTSYLLGLSEMVPQVPVSYTPLQIATYDRSELEQAAQKAREAREAEQERQESQRAAAEDQKVANDGYPSQESLDAFRDRMSALKQSMNPPEEWGEVVLNYGRKIVLRGPLSALSQIHIDSPSA